MKIKRLKINDLTKDGEQEETVIRVAVCDNFFSRLIGMIGKDFNTSTFDALALTPCRQIHTHFMSFPIDIVYLDRNGEVIKTEKCVEWGLFCQSVENARTVIELPESSIDKYGIAEGDYIRIE